MKRLVVITAVFAFILRDEVRAAFWRGHRAGHELGSREAYVAIRRRGVA